MSGNNAIEEETNKKVAKNNWTACTSRDAHLTPG